MLRQIRPAIVLLLLFTLLTGVAYPLIVTGIAQLAFPNKANGSLIGADGKPWDGQGKPAGSALIGQGFDDPKYFWGRISATSPVPYTAFSTDSAFTGSGGSNFGPLNPGLTDGAQGRIDALRKDDPGTQGKAVPVDLLTDSGSGLDPDISPAAAYFQVGRVAKARGLEPGAVQKIVDEHVQQRQLGLLGEPRVNVLALNLALDRIGEQTK